MKYQYSTIRIKKEKYPEKAQNKWEIWFKISCDQWGELKGGL